MIRLVRAAVLLGLSPLIFVGIVMASSSFGQRLGTYDKTDIFSNGDDPFYYSGRSSKYGIEWQCVEFVQRYWGEREWGPYNWGLNAFEMFGNKDNINFANVYENGSSTAPVPGDILVFGKNEEWPWGHVALVTGVANGKITFVQQNVGEKWQTSLQISPANIIDTKGRFSPVMGWLHSQLRDDYDHPEVKAAPSTATSTPAPFSYTLKVWFNDGKNVYVEGDRATLCFQLNKKIWYRVVSTFSREGEEPTPLWNGYSSEEKSCTTIPIVDNVIPGIYSIAAVAYVDDVKVAVDTTSVEIQKKSGPAPNIGSFTPPTPAPQVQQVQAPPPTATKVPPAPQAPAAPPPAPTSRPAPPPPAATVSVWADPSVITVYTSGKFCWNVSQAGTIVVTDSPQDGSPATRPVSKYVNAGTGCQSTGNVAPPLGTDTLRITLYDGNTPLVSNTATYQIVGKANSGPSVQQQPVQPQKPSGNPQPPTNCDYYVIATGQCLATQVPTRR